MLRIEGESIDVPSTGKSSNSSSSSNCVGFVVLLLLFDVFDEFMVFFAEAGVVDVPDIFTTKIVQERCDCADEGGRCG